MSTRNHFDGVREALTAAGITAADHWVSSAPQGGYAGWILLEDSHLKWSTETVRLKQGRGWRKGWWHYADLESAPTRVGAADAAPARVSRVVARLLHDA